MPTENTHHSGSSISHYNSQQQLFYEDKQHSLLSHSLLANNSTTASSQHHINTNPTFKMQFTTLLATTFLAVGMVAARPVPILVPSQNPPNLKRGMEVQDLWVDKRFVSNNGKSDQIEA